VLVLGFILGLGCILVPRVYGLLKNHFLFPDVLERVLEGTSKMFNKSANVATVAKNVAQILLNGIAFSFTSSVLIVTSVIVVNIGYDAAECVDRVNIACSWCWWIENKKRGNTSILTTIVLGAGEHTIDGDELKIYSAMNIVGDPGVAKEEIVVVGGIRFNNGIQGNCHLQHMTLRQAKKWGVYGWSSFTMKDVLVEQCCYSGVCADGTGVVGRCTNVEVRQCGHSGVFVSRGASIILIGAKTTVHHNCTKGNSAANGLHILGSSSSTIQLISPLTKENVSTDNGGGGNWGVALWDGAGTNESNNGDSNKIKTIAATTFT
jgi:hypothetical protein